MKALSLHQPYASLIAEGVQWIETRSWPAPKALIGERIAIHAAKSEPPDQLKRGPFTVYRQAYATRLLDERPPITDRWIALPLGAVVCTARLTDCIPIVAPSDEWRNPPYIEVESSGRVVHYQQLTPIFVGGFDVSDQLPYGDFTVGRYAWLLADIEPCDPPAPATGRQRLWEWTP